VSFWNSLFGGKKVSKEDEKSESPFMPEKKDPVEISFANNFISKGGRFLFSESELDCKNFLKIFSRRIIGLNQIYFLWIKKFQKHLI
jgi:hypothetical protein